MPFSDDPAQIRRIFGLRTKPFLDDFLGFSYKLFLRGLWAKDVIWGNTRLAQVDHFSPDDPPGRHINIALIVDKNGTFAPQLQSAGSQIFVCRFSNDFSYARGSRVEDVVESFLQQICRLLNTSSHHPGI